ncbi:MAG: ferrous iron transporter B [Clostridia bacterium]|nr:ferrous iron transporter B [Clostridia bacterium]
MRIALAGNPNSGKTTMFNALTGSNEKVGNWAGVTVDKKEGTVKKSFYREGEIVAVDLPGAYSMSPFTSEETITRDYVKKENLDAIINIVDATNLSRSLFFTTQLLELGIPVVVALNKTDINNKKKTKIDADVLSAMLGCPVVHTVSTSADGVAGVVAKAVEIKGKEQKAPYVAEQGDLTSKQAATEADRRRFEFVNKIVKEVEIRKIKTNEKNAQDKFDAIITNKWVGLPIFALVMWFVFWVSQAWIGPWLGETVLCPVIDRFGEAVAIWMEGTAPVLQTVVVDGIIGGVSAVLGFLPLVMVMYFLIALLEDCGYMARATVVLDPIFKKVGLSGKSVIPFVMGTGCAVPGVMACRTIKNERERRATAMLAPFMPCGAKLPVIGLFAGAFFGGNEWVGTLMYFAAIFIIFVGALLVNRVAGVKRKKSYFIIELPEYKIPNLWRAVKSMCGRGWAYIVKAGTVVLVCNAAITIMQGYGWNLMPAANADASILASIARPISVLLIPLGFGTWQMAAAAVSGFIAKENVVGTLASVYAISNFADVQAVTDAFGITSVSALACLMFNLFTPPCFAAIGAMNSEIGDKKWMLGGISLQIGTGYTVAYLVHTIGTLVTNPTLLDTGAAVSGLAAIAVMVGVVFVLIKKSDKELAGKLKVSKGRKI